LFSAQCKSLETYQDAPLDQTLLLIVQSETDGCLYVIEGVQHNIYALCNISGSVCLEKLQKLGTTNSISAPAVQHEAIRYIEEVPHQPWWRAAVIRTDPFASPLEAQARKPRLLLQRGRSLMQAQTLGDSPETQSNSQQPAEIPIQSNAAANIPEPAELFEIIKSQYQEALYASKVPLEPQGPWFLLIGHTGIIGILCQRSAISSSSKTEHM